MNNMYKIYSYTKQFKNYKKEFLLILFLSIVVAFLESFGIAMFFPILESIINDKLPAYFAFLDVFQLTNSKILLLISFLICFLVLIKSIIKVILNKKTSYLTWKIKEQWSCKLFKLVLESKYEFLVQKKQGEVINLINSQPLLACTTLERIIQFYSILFLIISYLIFMLIINFKITISIFFIGILYYILVSSFTSKKVSIFSIKRYELFKKSDELSVESVSMIKQIKVFGLEKYLEKDFKEFNSSITIAQVKFAIISTLAKVIPELVIVLIIFLFFLINHFYSIFYLKEILPTLFILGAISLRLISQISALISTQINILANEASFLSVEDSIYKFNLEQQEKEVLVKQKFNVLNSDIIIKSLEFNYENTEKVLKYGDLIIPKNNYIGIVGTSGSGKSTFVDILLKFYQTYKGQIIIDGTELKNIDTGSWRNKIGYVSQEPELFNDTILNNIIVSNKKTTFDRVVEISKQCFIHDFIKSLPNGYNTKIGDRGVLLSGGQKQRVAIARALINDPEIIIFDEATSALDKETEKIIIDLINMLKKSKTIIAIAHRETTLNNCDVIFDFSRE